MTAATTNAALRPPLLAGITSESTTGKPGIFAADEACAGAGGGELPPPGAGAELWRYLDRPGHSTVDVERDVTGVEVRSRRERDSPGLGCTRSQDGAALHAVEVEVVHVGPGVLD